MKFLIALISLLSIPTIALTNPNNDSMINMQLLSDKYTISQKQINPLREGPVKNVILNESSTSLSALWYPEMPNNVYSGSISDKYPQGNMLAYRFELRRTDPIVNDGKRSEIATLQAESPLEEHIYYFDTLLPEGGDEDYALDPESSEIIAQWHNVPDPGEEWTIPPLALKTFNGRYVLERAWDDAELSTNEQILKKGNRSYHNLGSYEQDKGRYVKWAFHIKWGWLTSQNPILEVYKDGVKILDLSGLPNTMNDKSGVHQKLGIYKWEWQNNPKSSIVDRRVIYINNVMVE